MLKKLTGLPDDTVLGRILKLWLWGLDYAPDGDLRKYDKGIVEEACGLQMEILIQVGLVDRKPFLRLHDWWDYAGRFLKIKYKNYEDKWKRIEKSYLGSPKNPLRTLTNLSNQPNQPNQPGVEDWFETIWQAYPVHRRHGKDVAFKRFEKTVTTPEDAKRCARALDRYLKSVDDQRYVLRGSKWFNEWEDHADERRVSESPNSSEVDAGSTQQIPSGGIDPAMGQVLDGLGNSIPNGHSKDRLHG